MTVAKKFEASLLLAALVWIWSGAPIISAVSSSTIDHGGDERTTDSADGAFPSRLEHSKLRVPDGCQLIYARVPSALEDGIAEEVPWATYTMTPRKKGTPVRRNGDIVVQWTDPMPDSLQRQIEKVHGSMLLREHTWNGQETGGHYEGHTRVESVVPGLGMTARSFPNKKSSHNLLPLVPRIDDGSLTRFDSPGAGAVTRYHNYTWWFRKDLTAGDELVYSRDGKWASSSQPIPSSGTNDGASSHGTPSPASLEHLRTHGFCMDNLRPRKSRIKGAGRGAFATRDLANDSVVAPIPVALVHRDELRKEDPSKNSQPTRHQLLLNYCFGHKSSEWLLFPYSPDVNLINHFNEPNVKLRWSAASTHNHTSEEKGTDRMLLLELVATRPIKKGEEIYLDYGRDWEDTWWNHVGKVWKPLNQHYTPSYVMDDTIKMVRTEKEQKHHPYPENLFTSCFYRYSDRSEKDKATAKTNRGKDSMTSFKWKLTKGLYDLKNLRPCKILKRIDGMKNGKSAYAVKMLNRPGLDDNESIPKDELHIITHLPRAAIRFSDKTGTTDQHLPNAFRHEIGLPEELLPAAWKIEIEETFTIEREL